MINKIIKYFWSLRKEFAKYFIIGISAFVSDVGSLYLLKEFAGFSATTSVIINQPLITLGVFYLNKKWSFRAGGLTHHQMIKFYILAAINYAISVSWIYLIHEKIGAQYLVTRTVNIAMSVSWNFVLYKYWVYKVPQNIGETSQKIESGV